jgi:hypothetical protein
MKARRFWRHRPTVPRSVIFALLFAGCYGPKLGTPGFFCHASDNPACPVDQVCLEGRCVNKSEAAHFDLSGVTDGPPGGQDQGGGGPTDLARTDSSKPADLSMPKDSGNVGGCGLKINELQTAGSAGLTDEFVEIYNSCATSIPVSGYQLVYHSASGTSNVVFVTFGSVNIAANGFFVCGGPGFSGTADVKYTGSSMASAGGGVAIFDGSGATLDSVGYGTATNSFVKGSAAIAPASAQSIGRHADGHDTADNSVDLTSTASPTPGAANN